MITRRAAALGVAICILLTLITAAYADTAPVYVNVLTAKVYKTPSTSAKTLGTMAYGEVMTGLEVRSGWVKVKNSSGSVGYCRQSDLTLSNPNFSARTMYSIADGVKVYSRPNTSYSAIGTVNSGGAVSVVAITPDGEWARLKNGNRYGYAKYAYFTSNKTMPEIPPTETLTDIYVISNTLTIRKSASDSASVLGTMSYGEHMRLSSISGGWAYVMNDSGARGYCKADGVSASNPNSAAKTITITKSSASYARPSASSSVVTRFSVGDTVSIVAITPDGNWARYQTPRGYAYLPTAAIANYTMPEEPPTTNDPLQAVTVYTIVNTLPIYASASTGAGVLGTMAYGDSFTCLSIDGDWAQVRNSTGQIGYCKASGISPSNPALSPVTYYVQADGVKAYARPDTSAFVIGTYNKNASVSVVAVTPDNNWARVQLSGGIGFIATAQLKSTQAGETNQPFTVYVSANTLKIYASASTSAGVLGTMAYGDGFTCLTINGDWAQVRNSSNQLGWCLISGITTTNPAQSPIKYYVQADGIKAYKRPDASTNVVGAYNKNAEVSVVAVTPDGNWARIQLLSGFGFIATAQLKGAQVSEPDQPFTVYVTKNTLKIYASASASAGVLGTMAYGDSFTCLNVNGDWAQVKNSSNQLGWCAANAISTTNPAQSPAIYYVQSDNVKAYKRPETSSGVVGSFSKNSTAQVVAVTPDNNWARVQISGGFGFIATSQLKSTKPETNDPFPVYVVNNTLPIYAQANVTSGVLGTMAFGDGFTCLSVTGDWAQVKNSYGQLGWCLISGISATNPAALTDKYFVQADKVKAYKRPDTATATVGTYNKNAAVTVVGVTGDGNWARVQVSNGYGFIHTSYLKSDQAQAFDPYAVYVSTYTLPIYASASASSTLLGTMAFGESFTCLSVTGDWAQVKNASNQLGYCKASGLTNVNPNALNAAYFAQSDGVKAYRRPDTTSYVAATYGKNASLTVVAVTGDGVWGRVKLSNSFAYVKLSQLSQSKVAEAYAAYVTAATLPIYASPNTTSTLLGTLAFGEGLICQLVNGDWAQVKNSSGALGYCAANGISATNPNSNAMTYYAQSAGVKAYAKPGTSYGVAQTFAKNAVVNVVAVTADKKWARVKLSNGYAYVEFAQIATAKVQEEYAVYVSANMITIYNKASTSGNALGTMCFGETMTCVNINGDWAQVKNAGGQLGYCKKSGLTTTNPNVSGKTYYAQSDGTQAYAKPDVATTIKGTYARGATVVVVAVSGDNQWARVQLSSSYAYVKTSLLGTTKPSGGGGGAGYVDTYKGTASASIEKVIALGVEQYGDKYVYATAGPDTFDCSGFTRYCYKSIGITLQRSAYAQGYDTSYKKIESINDLKRGDIVCFNTVDSDNDLSDHTGLYLGGGKFIHASSGAGQVTVSSLTSGYYNGRFSWGLRIVN